MTGQSARLLDEALLQAGKWGKFQLIYYTCLGFVVIFSVFTMNYIFVARDIKYRCFIEDCNLNSSILYNPAVLQNFVPYKDGFPERCLKYNYSSNFDEELCQNYTNEVHVQPNSLMPNTTTCSKFVFERSETTIVHDFHIFCSENLWKLTLVGTVNVAGELVSLAYTGFLSDRYGRKTIMCSSLLLSSISGLLKSFSPNYLTFIFLEFLDTALGGAMYGAAFVLAMELVIAKERNMGNTIISCLYSLGQVVFGVVAWLTPTWRVMIRVLYLPGLLAIPLWIFMPESIRWLLSKNRVKDAETVLNSIAQINGKTLSHHQLLNNFLESDVTKAKKENFVNVLKNPVLLVRTIHCSLTWVCCTFVFYGLTIHSVNISENIYLSFICGAIAETPGYIIYYYANEKSGRRKLMSFALVLGGAFCLAVGFLPEGWPKLLAFFCGKCCLTVAYTVLYVFTTELFPTSSRHSMFSICSMFGRFGSVVAPQIPLMARVWTPLPMFLFSLMSTTVGILALFFPETSNLPLPHTVEEAVNIRRAVIE